MKKNMKKVMSAVLAATMVFSLTACGSNEKPAETQAAAPAETQTAEAAGGEAVEGLPDMSSESVLFATFEVGSSNYNITAEIAKLWEDNGFGTVDVQPISPGGMGAPYMFEEAGADIAFSNGAPAKWAHEDGVLGKPATGGYRAMIGGMTGVSAVNFMTEAFIEKHGVTTVEEAIRQQKPIRMGVGNVGSMDVECLAILLNYLGVTEEDIASWGGAVVHASGSELTDMVKDGTIDFMLDHTSQNSSTMTEIALTCDVVFNQWEEETLDYFVNEKGFQRVSVPAGSFGEGAPAEDIVNAGTPDCLFVNENMSEDVAYFLTKVLCENRDYLVSVFSSLEFFDPATCWEAEKVAGIELHPGAARYYKEAGYMK